MSDVEGAQQWWPSARQATKYPVELTTTPKMAAEMQRRGWRPPAEVIAAEEELIALPNGSVVLPPDGKARAYFAGLLGPVLKLTTPDGGSVCGYLPDRFFPAQLLYRAEEDRHTDGLCAECGQHKFPGHQHHQGQITDVDG